MHFSETVILMLISETRKKTLAERLTSELENKQTPDPDRDPDSGTLDPDCHQTLID